MRINAYQCVPMRAKRILHYRIFVPENNSRISSTLKINNL